MPDDLAIELAMLALHDADAKIVEQAAKVAEANSREELALRLCELVGRELA